MRTTRATALAAVAVGVVVMACGFARLGSTTSQPSDNLRLLEADTSWLHYLPAGSSHLNLQLASLTSAAVTGTPTRRVDLVEEGRSRSISLCFAVSEAALRASCPGAVVLGRTSRVVDAPWIGQLGESSEDMLPLLDAPAPTLRQASSLAS